MSEGVKSNEASGAGPAERAAARILASLAGAGAGRRAGREGDDDPRVRADRLIARLDEELSRQVNAILHHPRFRRLEASWRQLRMLCDMPHGDSEIVVRVMSVTWPELARDIDRAAEFDRSWLFDLIYAREFDMPGGKPYGLLIGDYHVTAGIHPEFGTDDVATLEGIAAVAAASFSPFVCSAAPDLLDVERFAELDRELDLAYLRDIEGNAGWARLRNGPDSRFIGITCPDVLVRRPYRRNDPFRQDGFCFTETVAPDGSTLCFGPAAYAFALVALREYGVSGWFADIRGARHADRGGGLVDQFAPLVFDTDRNGFAAQPPVEIRLTPAQEQMLSHFGLIPLMPVPYSTALVFNSNQSVHAPARYASELASQNARIAAMLQYVLCASRFAHYLKLIMRENIGQIADAGRLQAKLREWLSDYTLANDDAAEKIKARRPLRAAGVRVSEIPGKPGVYSCVMQLQPHFQLDDVSASFQLTADMNNREEAGRQP